MNQYVAGDLVTLTIVFLDPVAQLPVDPSSFVLNTSVNWGQKTVTNWNGVSSSGAYTITRQSVGTYIAEVDTTAQPGSWFAKAVAPPGSGAQAAGIDGFLVSQPPL